MLTVGPWPPNPNNYVFFGASTLNQSGAGNYALLQASAGNETGRTFLNSPLDIKFRIKNQDKMVLSTTDRGGRLAVVGDRITLDDPTSEDTIDISTNSLRGTNIDNPGNSISSGERLLIRSRAGSVSVEGKTGVVLGRRGAPGQPGTDAISVPQGALHVVGEIALTEVNVWDETNANDLTWNGTKITREGSSQRYKANISPLETDFHKILDLEPKQYQMKDGFGEPDK